MSSATWTKCSLALIVAALALGCGDDSSAADAGPPDACVGATGCNGECEVGNAYGVGRFCSEGGGQCQGLPAFACTVDFEDTTEAFCTRPCNPEDDVEVQCGQDAVCRGEEIGGSGPSGCVPIMCQ